MLSFVTLIYIVTLFCSMLAIHTMPAASPALEIVALIPGAVFAHTLTLTVRNARVNNSGVNRHPLSGVKGADWGAVWQARKALGLPGVNHKPDPTDQFLRNAPKPRSTMQWNPLTRSFV